MDGSALPLDFVEKNGSSAGHVQRRHLPGHGDGDDLVAVLAAALAQAAGFLVAEFVQQWGAEFQAVMCARFGEHGARPIR